MHSYLFPTSYSHWLASRLPATLQETLATCQNCAMLKPIGETRDPGPFLSGLKCCTYFPFIPNFSLGQISATQIENVAKIGILLPVGLYPSISRQRLGIQLGKDGFGQKQELLCPFFSSEQDACSIWANRPSVCTTYFCKSDRGRSGLQLWADIEKYLNDFEWTLACETLKRMGVHENTLAFSQSALSEETEDDERSFFVQAAWNSAASFFDIKTISDQILFYQKAAMLARQIQATDLDQLLNTETLLLEKKILSLL